MSKNFDRLRAVFQKLNSPTGCAWDRKQTHRSLLKYLREETAEFASAVGSGNPSKMADELGDVLLQVMFHAQIAEKSSEFTIDDVIKGLIAKLKRRHPHVFARRKVGSVREIIANWNEIKRKEKNEIVRRKKKVY
ncbi:MAG: hypothetical protein CVU77_07320 [Elusimicrobia bacterium HGW-Elusimicrobia-1]|jgi:tetrapyrrole methylase family protein/MazG family protein|nr:MAG: hypothetical protein CVU77_07320 [Elusimicrobia bacterium HGW-Elusimicrobia-1]